MLVSYTQNSNVSMDKQTYLEMCEMLGTEPDPKEMPVELSDFPPTVQHAMLVYSHLDDRWDYMVGRYLGKDKTGLLDVFKLLEVDPDEYNIVFKLLNTIDTVRKQEIDKQLAQKPAK